jgi:hypothetical protein
MVTAIDSSGNESRQSAGASAALGVAGGGQIPGDFNQDAGVDISDGIAIFGYLFLGQNGPVCPSGMDFNGDGNLDISDGIAILGYLFQGRGPHALGASCVPIADCPVACN